MKKVFYAVTALLGVCYLMTAIICNAGDDGYHLVIKPYPSFLKNIPHMEESRWERLVASGEIPAWVANHDYREVAYGADELEVMPWKKWYGLFLLLAEGSFLALVVMILKFLCRKFRYLLKRRHAKAGPH